MIRDEIKESLKKALNELGIEDIEPALERPKDSKNGDYSSSVALGLAKKLDFKNPLDLAQKIVEILNNNKDLQDNCSKIEAKAPGFINFYLSNKYLQNQLQEIIKRGDNYGLLEIAKGKKASVEFVSANPTGPLHIGNAVGGPLGDVIANVLTKAGYKVTREYLHNNVGGQVEHLGEAIYFELHPDQKTETYAVQYQGEYIKDLAKKVKEAMPKEDDLSESKFIEKAGEIAVELLLTEILKDCEDLGIKFDKVVKESDLRKEVPRVLLKIKKYIKQKDKAEWFAPNDEFLKDRETVVKKSTGEYTYFASDIAYHDQKLANNDFAIDILGSNHSGHVPRLKAVVKALGYDPNNLRVILCQYVRLKKGTEFLKMSKRTGSFVTAREVLDEVGKDAFRFFLLRSSPETHLDFDLELAKRQASENPVFYIQYAYSRICSIFKKAPKISFSNPDVSLLTAKEEVALIRQLLKLPLLIEEVSYTLAVHSFTNYALELATFFHKFYETQQVISEDSKLTSARLALIKATQITLKNTLDILGVSAPEKM